MSNYNLFLSHSWSYSTAYDGLVKLLDAAPRFDYSNYSVPKNDPIHNAPNSTALEKAISDQMKWCGCVLIVGGVYATYSTWIKKEIAIAQGYPNPKPIICIKPWAAERVSEVVQKASIITVGWNTSSIVDAIRAYSL